MPEITAQHPVAYFCAEFGLEANLPLYAGGLGILAGDTVKEASDQSFSFVAVGLLYRGEGAIQKIDEDGHQLDEDLNFDPLSSGLEHVYIDDMPLFIKIHLTEIDVWTRVWKKTLPNNLVLYLLDTDTDQNMYTERAITHALYSGTEESLVKQQLILGIGGVKLLHALNIHPSIYHIQEGRPAFLHWQLIRDYMDTHGMSYEQARDLAKSKTVYTNHTLISAGNQSYNIHLLKTYGQHYAGKMGISIDELLEPGMEDSDHHFVMTRFALNVSSKANGVSELHSRLSKEHWPEYNWCNVTNGVHMPTWQKSQIAQVTDSASLWREHLTLKRELNDYLVAQTGFGFNPDYLTVTWARRIVEYKQLNRLFDDVARLKAILKNDTRPVQILIAGKAHTRDTRAKMILQEAIHYMQGELNGNALFVPNYNIEISKRLVSGSDVWLNIPEYGQEACGTSGMKAISNGVLQFTVADGWAAEVDWAGMGWVIDHTSISSSVYHYLEKEIAPMYYLRDSGGIPQDWLTRMQRSIELSKRFSTARMLQEYKDKLYK